MFINLLCIGTGVCTCVFMCPQHTYGGQTTTYKSWFSLHHVSPRDLIQDIWLGSKCLYLLGNHSSHLNF